MHSLSRGFGHDQEWCVYGREVFGDLIMQAMQVVAVSLGVYGVHIVKVGRQSSPHGCVYVRGGLMLATWSHVRNTWKNKKQKRTEIKLKN